MSEVQHPLSHKVNVINYKQITTQYPWIIQKEQCCILSPDSDGLLSGLLMSHYLDWKIKGFYDGKIMLVDKDVSPKECVFLDMDVFRQHIRSVGHHMVLYNKDRKPSNWNNYKNCIQPNNLREYDGYHNFQFKYPLATIHFLIGILGSKIRFEIPKSAICPLLYTDGVFKSLFNYPKNCLNWLRFLKADENLSLKQIFFNDYYSVHDLMLSLSSFFDKISQVGNNRRNDKIKISNSNGQPENIVSQYKDIFSLTEDETIKAVLFIKILSSLTGWKYKESDWQWKEFKLHVFKKKNIRANNRNFEEMLKNNPVTWAMTRRNLIEYTLDPSHILEQ